jgi:hypothetical protein
MAERRGHTEFLRIRGILVEGKIANEGFFHTEDSV